MYKEGENANETTRKKNETVKNSNGTQLDGKWPQQRWHRYVSLLSPPFPFFKQNLWPTLSLLFFNDLIFCSDSIRPSLYSRDWRGEKDIDRGERPRVQRNRRKGEEASD